MQNGKHAKMFHYAKMDCYTAIKTVLMKNLLQHGVGPEL